jgi:hypothetical protein
MGLLPDDFYRMRTDDFNLLRRGFFNKREYDAEVIRKAVAIIITPWLKSPADPRRIWPLSVDRKYLEEERRKSQETLAKMREGIQYIKQGKVIVAVSK